MDNEIQTPQQPTPPIASSPMKEAGGKSFLKNKLFLIFVGIIFILSIIYIGLNFGFTLGLNQNYSAFPIPTPDPPTANWQTYLNEDIWFEIKYPKDWFNITKEEANIENNEKLYEFSNRERNSTAEDLVILQLRVSHSQSQIALADELNKTNTNEKLKKDQATYTKIADFTVFDLAAVQYIADRSGIPAGLQSKNEEVIFRFREKIFVAALKGTSKAVQNNRNTLYQILLTFKPLKSKLSQDMNICEVDSDCVIVPFFHCCGMTKQAINKKWEKFYRRNSEFHIISEADNPDLCAVIPQCPDDSEINEVLCAFQPDNVKRCQLKF